VGGRAVTETTLLVVETVWQVLRSLPLSWDDILHERNPQFTGSAAKHLRWRSHTLAFPI
jgi:hypothetical protein